jgi:DsbC/DsbD-like thiol-disulfide interchange protein
MRLGSAGVWRSALYIVSMLAACCWCVSSAVAQPAAPAYGRVSLVARDAVLQGGQVATLGLLFELRPGWHTYWVNPGDAGAAPQIEWDLPAGFRAGEIRWPAPGRFLVGSLVDYGYEGTVVLQVPLHVPAGYQAGTPVRLGADLRFMVCRDLCVSARTRLALALPAIASGPVDPILVRERFRASDARLPRPAPSTWNIRAVETPAEVILELQAGSLEPGAVFFPLEPGRIDNAAPQTVTAEGRDRVRLTLRKSELNRQPLSVLKGILVRGPDRVFEVSVPVRPGR